MPVPTPESNGRSDAEFDHCLHGGYFLHTDTIGSDTFVTRWHSRIHGPGWLVFSDPAEVLVAKSVTEVASVLDSVDDAIAGGLTATGFVTYEGSLALHWPELFKPGWPVLAHFTLHREPPRFYNHLLDTDSNVSVMESRAEMSPADYSLAFDKVKNALAEGESYEVNLTYRHIFSFNGEGAALFADRCGVDPPPYATFVRGSDWQLLSYSPELFFQRSGSDVVMRPMKGTVASQGKRELDEEIGTRLQKDEKTLAENLMIVDMTRNDLGSICEIGSISVPEFMQIERHRSLLQAVSSVTGVTSAPLSNLLKALLPVASVTGAPKLSTCRIIHKLESSPRNAYCGVIGIATKGYERFSVAIRTALCPEANGKGEFGVGGAIVWDSRCADEYAECEAKTDFLQRPGKKWSLVEAMSLAAAKNGAARDKHLDRLKKSASRVGIPFNERTANEALDEIPADAPADLNKVRLVMDANGKIESQLVSSDVQNQTIKAVIAPYSISSRDVGLSIKSTARQQFDDMLDRSLGFPEVLLYNEKGELTEFSRGSLIVLQNGKYISPDPECGCLPGIAVADLVRSGAVVYGRILLRELANVNGVWFSNAVVGVKPIEVFGRDGKAIVESHLVPTCLRQLSLQQS